MPPCLGPLTSIVKNNTPSLCVRELQVHEILCLMKGNNNTETVTEKIIITKPETGTRMLMRGLGLILLLCASEKKIITIPRDKALTSQTVATMSKLGK